MTIAALSTDNTAVVRSPQVSCRDRQHILRTKVETTRLELPTGDVTSSTGKILTETLFVWLRHRWLNLDSLGLECC